MNTPLNFEINYGNVNTKPPTSMPRRVDPNAPLFASEDGLVASLSNNECVFQVKRSGESHVMTYQVLQALDQCREFRSLEEHAARIFANIPGLQSQREGVVRVLASLNQYGLLISDQEFLKRYQQGEARQQAPMRAVFIRACDRPAQLEQLLLSLTEYERQFRANRHYVLIDDSTRSEASNRHRDLLREFARATGCKLSYLGAGEQARFVERLSRDVPQARQILPKLLLRGDEAGRFGGGRGWNLALLLSAGGRLALLDDDQRFPLRRLESAQTGINPNPNVQGYSRFFRNMEEALGAGEDVEGDPFELHLEAVGQGLGVLARSERFQLDRHALQGLSLTRLDMLQSDAHILATLHGNYGSSRTESGAWLYQINAESRADFCKDRDSYLRNIEAGSLWYGFQQARVTRTASFTPFGLDNSRLLPCTNPIGRGEDGLFSVVAHLCHPNSLVMELPLAIGHVQEIARKRSDKTLSAHTPRVNHFVSDFIQRQLGDFLSEDPVQRLNLLSANLRDVAGASERARTQHLREYLSFARADLIERLQQQFEAAPDAPIYWQADVRSIIEANGRALIAKSAPRLGDWPETYDETRCANALREELNQLASFYEAWPALWAHAHEQGEKLLASV